MMKIFGGYFVVIYNALQLGIIDRGPQLVYVCYRVFYDTNFIHRYHVHADHCNTVTDYDTINYDSRMSNKGDSVKGKVY